MGYGFDKLAASWGLDRLELGTALFMVFAFASGVQAHLMPAVFPITQSTTDGLLLVICALLLGMLHRRHHDPRFWYWAAATYVLTFFTEALGVATGRVFGAYHYGPTMWVQWLGVPLVIALNWTTLILATNDLAWRLFRHPVVISLVAATLIVGYDYFIEPVAIRLDYWQWHGGDIPLQNYLAWGLIALAFSLPLNLLRIRYQSPLLLVYGVAQWLFFVALGYLL